MLKVLNDLSSEGGRSWRLSARKTLMTYEFWRLRCEDQVLKIRRQIPNGQALKILKTWRLWRSSWSLNSCFTINYLKPLKSEDNVTVSKEVHSTEMLYPTSSRLRFKLWKRTYVAVLSYPWVTLLLSSQKLSNGYIFKGLYKKIKWTDQSAGQQLHIRADCHQRLTNGIS